MSPELAAAIARLIDAAHTASEYLDDIPDDEGSARASREVSEAAAAVDRLLQRETARAEHPHGCGRPLEPGQHWDHCNASALCTECGGFLELASETKV